MRADRCIAALGAGGSPPEVQKAIRRMSELIANKLLHTPLSALKAGEQDVDTMVQITQRLFALAEDEVSGEDAAPPAGLASQGKKG